MEASAWQQQQQPQQKGWLQLMQNTAYSDLEWLSDCTETGLVVLHTLLLTSMAAGRPGRQQPFC
jgi:hypothetical protein